jgi:5-methylcytosine-specific restriction endonuclease McrA
MIKMTEGWKLNEGTASYQHVSEDQLWSIIMKTLSSQSNKTTSYKFALLRAILENLYKMNQKLEVSFDQLAESFAKLYWNLVIRNGYSQGYQAQIEKELKDFQGECHIPIGVSFDSLQENQQRELIKRIESKVIRRYVVGALFADTEGLVYGFSKKERKLTITSICYEFLLKYQTNIFKLTNYELAKFLQKKNPDLTQGIFLEEIENITQRQSLQQFQQMIVTHSGSTCFYTDRPLQVVKRSIAVDHFVPWSFVHSDELWNFVLTSSSLNSSKGSKLPAERYLNKLDERNQLFKKTGDVYVKQYMETYDFHQFVKLYEYAELNGFEKGWAP